MNTTNTNTRNLCISAVFMALTFVVTRFVQIPIPLGYFNVGNSVILTACMIVPSPYGLIIGSVASALADLTSYPVYTLPTLVIKFLMPLVFYKIWAINPSSFKIRVGAIAVSTLIPLFGYTITGAIIYGSLITGLAQFPGLLLEYIANLVILVVIARSRVPQLYKTVQ